MANTLHGSVIENEAKRLMDEIILDTKGEIFMNEN